MDDFGNKFSITEASIESARQQTRFVMDGWMGSEVFCSHITDRDLRFFGLIA